MPQINGIDYEIVWIDPSVHSRIKMLSGKLKKPMKDVVAEAIELLYVRDL